MHVFAKIGAGGRKNCWLNASLSNKRLSLTAALLRRCVRAVGDGAYRSLTGSRRSKVPGTIGSGVTCEGSKNPKCANEHFDLTVLTVN
jgi:hypothetical protein